MAHIPEHFTFNVGDLVMATSDNPYLDKFRRAGKVGVITEVIRCLPAATRDYLEKWGDIDFAWVLIGGEMWSMGPNDMCRLDPCKSNTTGV